MQRVTGIQEAPNINTKNTPKSVVVGRIFKQFCRVTGRPEPYIKWYFQGRLVDRDTLESPVIDGFSLRIDKVKKEDAGVYSCKAENMEGIDWLNVTLKVIGQSRGSR